MGVCEKQVFHRHGEDVSHESGEEKDGNDSDDNKGSHKAKDHTIADLLSYDVPLFLLLLVDLNSSVLRHICCQIF